MTIINGLTYWSFRGGSNGKYWSRPSANVVTIEALLNGTSYRNGESIINNPHNHGGSGNTNAVCNAGGQNDALKGYIGQVVVADAQFTVPQLKRLTFSGAFSFKIACS